MAQTIYNRFAETASKYARKTALVFKKHGHYSKISYGELKDSIDAVAAAMGMLGLMKGDAVGIFSYNRPEWQIADLSVLKQGGIVVPIYHTLPPSYVKYIINDAKIKLLFVENKELLSVINSIRGQIPHLETVIIFDDSGTTSNRSLIKFSDLRHMAGQCSATNPVVSEEDVASIVYTSGTTGEPKGVMLTHKNIVSNIDSIIKRFRPTPVDVIVSYLPLCHMFERTCGYYTMLFAGCTICFTENFSTVLEDVRKLRPTWMIAVPRVIEKAYTTAVNKVEGSSPITKAMVFSAIKNLNEYVNLQYKKMKVPFKLRAKCWIHNHLIASKFKSIVGGRLKVIVSGGAPLNPKIAKVLYILGFNVIEGYGLTEASPVVASNLIEENRLGTVGKPLEGVEIKIGENEEILVKGPNVMKGYLNKPEETGKMIDRDRWLHTGDQGKFDERGNLIITGRLKEIIITSYGKKIAPSPIEEKICMSQYIEQVMIYGDRRKSLIALVVPNRESIEQYAKQKAISFNNYEKLLEMNEIEDLFNSEIEMATKDLASYEKVKAFSLLPEGFTLDNGMLTPTLKLRKLEIANKYARLIEITYEKLEKSAEK